MKQKLCSLCYQPDKDNLCFESVTHALREAKDAFYQEGDILVARVLLKLERCKPR